MCLAIYLAADHPLPMISDSTLRVTEVTEHRRRPVLPGEFVYRLGTPGCACDLLSDGLTPEEEAERQTLLEHLGVYLTQATQPGPVETLVCWEGDQTKPAVALSLPVGEFLTFDFNDAWDRPSRVTLASA
jgi:hypothetical protein